ncbi:MAG: cation-translocating P-type ATPase [Deltaproteobacteria bacterium]|nr:cation-translocating P-type ATPase [Deltaproteobacteria bacterium]MBW1952393.1 cation-translocating P-type ATPase [Deltaproteobacteria bacterium]MBW1985904.1 cation-translocating P-type ATPase [Deltaproteobacteria bacterium]MBW2133664.1 cation-translocating P-type ATPase [Deltaproteobacteria bacterium]
MNSEKDLLPSFHTMPLEEVFAALDTGPKGLQAAQVEERQRLYGPNELVAGHRVSVVDLFLGQFKNILIIILLIATAISLMLGETLDALVIFAIVMASTILGFIQEYRAERAVQALKQMAAPTATVIRGGEEFIIPAREVVPGDLLVLHTGDRVAADGRVVVQMNLMADEAPLTGESTPVRKDIKAVDAEDTPLGDRTCMVYGATVITYGRGQAVVTATGMNTAFGQIARMLGEITHEKTPLELRMASIGRLLGLIALAICALAALLGVWRGYGWLEMFIWGVSLAVAAVPEALPAVVTGALAIGTTKMARRNAIVKRLPAVETMGCTTVICTDKTGTLTRNEMTVRQLYLDDTQIEVTGSGYLPQGEFLASGQPINRDNWPTLNLAARISLLCNDAVLKETNGIWSVWGDPTEGALLVLARKAGLDYRQLTQDLPRVGEVPFDSERRRMTTVHQTPEGQVAYVKGAPESLLRQCQRQFYQGEIRPLLEEDRQRILTQADAMAAAALRVLGLAYRQLPDDLTNYNKDNVEGDLVWVGLVGMIDPARPEASASVAQCHRAGIRVIMVTGDHPATAAAIGREIGLLASNPGEASPVLTGRDLTRLSDEQLLAVLPQTPVFARVAPEHKLRLVNLLKAQGEIVAMTGDGVNDAPALKRADIGVAMGITGTEVTKETAAMILADDNFASLVAAVEEGRVIFDNIKKYLIFLLTCNIGEILVLSLAFFLGLPLPLIAIQILWVNLTTDGLPALALGVDPKDPDVMQRPPRPPNQGLFTRPVNTLLTVIPIHLLAVLLPLFAYYYYSNPSGYTDPHLILVKAQTITFVGIVLLEMVNAFNCRSEYYSLWRMGLLKNRFLIGAVLSSLALLAAVVEWEPLARLFHTIPLSLEDWLIALGVSLTILPSVELTKWILRRLGANAQAA